MGETVGRALRDSLRGLPRAADESARAARAGVQDRAEAARPRAHLPLHAMARAGAARIRADVRSGDHRARLSASRWRTSRRFRTGLPTRRPRSRRRGQLTLNAAAKIDAGDEARVEISLIKFFGREGAARRYRSRDPGAWRDGRVGGHAAGEDVSACALRTNLRWPRRSASDGGGAANRERVQEGPQIGLRPRGHARQRKIKITCAVGAIDTVAG